MKVHREKLERLQILPTKIYFNPNPNPNSLTSPNPKTRTRLNPRPYSSNVDNPTSTCRLAKYDVEAKDISSTERK
eukprot:1371691-Amorphochlora_amoeboformis.AAC.1